MAQGDTLVSQKVNTGSQPANSVVPRPKADQPLAENNPTQKIPSSPWEEDVDVPEVSPKSNPTVVGSFAEPAREPEKPFSVPQNVSEPVGKKIPAAEIINQNPRPKADQPLAENIQTAETPAPTPPTLPLQRGGAKPPVGGDIQSAPKPPTPASAKPSDDLLDQIDWFGDKNPVPGTIASTTPMTPPEPIQPTNSLPNVLPAPINTAATPAQSSPAANSLISNIKSRIADNKKEEASSAGSGMRGKIMPGAIDSGGKEQKQSLGIKKTLLFSLLGILLAVAGLIALNEFGIFSVGFEKVYGAIGLESLWGGLPSKAENALAMSAVKTKQHPNFKAKGKIVFSINSGIKSEVTDPLVSVGSSVSLRDQVVAMTQEGILTQASNNSADYYNGSTPLTTGSSTPLTTGSSTSSTSSTSDSTSAADSSSSSSAVSTTSPIKSVTTLVQLKSTSTSSEADLSVGSSSFIIKNQQEKLFVNGNSNIAYGGNSDASKWVEYDFGQLKNKVVQKNIFDIKTTSGYSAKGSRISEEVVGGVRCYKYNLQSLEIGNSLSSIGISSDSIQSISGDVWIGIRDKLIRKVSLNIVPSPSISITSMQVDLEFYDFDVVNTIGQINSSDMVSAASAIDLSTVAGRDTRRKADVKSILSALKQYKAVVGSYPKATSLLNLSQSKNIIESALVSKYIAFLPADPKTGWYYAYKSDGSECSVSARLENQNDTDGQLISNILLYLQYNNN